MKTLIRYQRRKCLTYNYNFIFISDSFYFMEDKNYICPLCKQKHKIIIDDFNNKNSIAVLSKTSASEYYYKRSYRNNEICNN